MNRASNPIRYRNDEQRSAAYKSIGLCDVCGERAEKCLHAVLRGLMDVLDYDAFLALDPDYEALRLKRQALMDARARRDDAPTLAESVAASTMCALPPDEVLSLETLAGYVPPEAEQQTAENDTILEWLGVDERKQETQAFLARMNAPEMIARRGTMLTPHGWRLPE